MDKEQTNRSLLGDLTFTQVVAGAAASAASFALAKQTGILGSVIGAAVGSVAATLAGAVFTSMIDRSVEGIRGIETTSGDAVQSTAQLGYAPQPARRTHKHALIALAIAAAAGLAAVWVYAAGVDIFTEGKGIGTQAPVIEYVMAPQDFAPAPEEEPADDDATEETAPEDTAETDPAPTSDTTEQVPETTEGGSTDTTGAEGAGEQTSGSETGAAAFTDTADATATSEPVEG